MGRLLIAVLIVLGSCEVPRQGSLSNDDEAAIKEARQKYTQAWLDGDSVAVMRSLTSDAVLIPHHGDPQIEGKEAIREFWWPPQSPPTKVLRFTSDIAEISGNRDLAYVRGRFLLEFSYDSLTYLNQGNFLNVVVHTEDGWKLARLIWNDPLPEIAP